MLTVTFDAGTQAGSAHPPGRMVADEPPRGFPWDLPAVRALRGELELSPGVTFFIGENGSGKSTLLEAFAVAARHKPRGGIFELRLLHPRIPFRARRGLRLVRGTRRPRTDFFLRAESLFTAATWLKQLPADDDDPVAATGDPCPEQSHGESFLAVLLHRFGPDGLYLLDEPEAALSTQNCLTALRRIHELIQQGSQFVIATHSPILLAYPGALIYAFETTGVHPVAFDEPSPCV